MASVESTRDDVLTSEVDLLRRLDHKNILKIHEVIDTKTKMFIFLELVRGGDLYDKLKREGNLTCHVQSCVIVHCSRVFDVVLGDQVALAKQMPERSLFKWQKQSHTFTRRTCHTVI